MQSKQTHSWGETYEAAKAYAKTLKGGEVLALTGDLGAGKTVFAKGLAAGLAIAEEISSPTFQIVKEYEGRLHLNHFDFYRLEDAAELREIGFLEYTENGGVTVVEWADLFPGHLPARTIWIRIGYIDKNIREITFENE